MNYRILSLTVSFVLALSLTSCNQDMANVEVLEETPAGLKWYTLENAMLVNKSAKKKVLVDVYTSWCGWCKVMDKKTFTNPEVVEYLNENFVLVKFNAEVKEPVEFKGETFEFKKMGRRGANGLAIKMLDGRLAYPSLVYLDSDFNKIRTSPGYKTPDKLLNELKTL